MYVESGLEALWQSFPFRRLSDTPGADSSTKKDGLPPSLSRSAGRRASSQLTPEVDPQTILNALFKSTMQSSPQNTAFRVKL